MISARHTSSAVNPARAGMIPQTASCAAWRRCKPRASGDDPAYPTVKAVIDG